MSIFSILNHPCSFVVYYYSISLVFFYLCKILFSGFLQFNGNFADGQNNSLYRDWALLTVLKLLYYHAIKFISLVTWMFRKNHLYAKKNHSFLCCKHDIPSTIYNVNTYLVPLKAFKPLSMWRIQTVSCNSCRRDPIVSNAKMVDPVNQQFYTCSCIIFIFNRWLIKWHLLWQFWSLFLHAYKISSISIYHLIAFILIKVSKIWDFIAIFGKWSLAGIFKKLIPLWRGSPWMK